MPQYPDLVQNYVEYVQVKAAHAESGKVDLKNVRFIYPTTLLPLSMLILEDPSGYTKPDHAVPRGHISAVLHPSSQRQGKSHIALAPLTHDKAKSYTALQAIYDMSDRPDHHNSTRSAFAYAMAEIVSNIYEHSEFSRALVLGQRYDHKGFLDLSFIDDGVTIPGSLMAKVSGSPSDLIRTALNGKSIKDESRGFGLRTTFKMFTDGIGADFFVASGGGAVYGGKEVKSYGGKDCALQYDLQGVAKIDGTLITMRIPLEPPAIDIYRYVE